MLLFNETQFTADATELVQRLAESASVCQESISFLTLDDWNDTIKAKQILKRLILLANQTQPQPPRWIYSLNRETTTTYTEHHTTAYEITIQ